MDIFRNAHDKSNLKKDMNSELKTKLRKVNSQIYCFKTDQKTVKNS